MVIATFYINLNTILRARRLIDASEPNSVHIIELKTMTSLLVSPKWIDAKIRYIYFQTFRTSIKLTALPVRGFWGREVVLGEGILGERGVSRWGYWAMPSTSRMC